MDEILEKEKLLELERKNKIKKVFIFLIGIFILAIFLIYVFSTSVGNDILASLISSFKMKENEVDFSFAGKLVFLNKSLEDLKKVYLENQRVEFKACLNGKKMNRTYFIEEVFIPQTYSQKFNQVVAEPCPSGSLVSLHSHPYKNCLASEQDFKSFKAFKEKNKEGLMVVMCEDKRFGIYE